MINPRLPPVLSFVFLLLFAALSCNVEKRFSEPITHTLTHTHAHAHTRTHTHTTLIKTLKPFQSVHIYSELWYVCFMCFRSDCNAFNTTVKHRHLRNPPAFSSLTDVRLKCVSTKTQSNVCRTTLFIFHLCEFNCILVMNRFQLFTGNCAICVPMIY